MYNIEVIICFKTGVPTAFNSKKVFYYLNFF